MGILGSASGGDVTLAFLTMLTAFVTVGIPSMVKARKADREARAQAVAAATAAAAAAAEAKQAAAEASESMEIVKATLGEKNGHGDAMTMLAKSLTNQYEMLQNQQHVKDMVEAAAHSQIAATEIMNSHIQADEAFQARVEPFLAAAEAATEIHNEPGPTEGK